MSECEHKKIKSKKCSNGYIITCKRCGAFSAEHREDKAIQDLRRKRIAKPEHLESVNYKLPAIIY